MKTITITQLKNEMLEIFESCQTEEYLITRWGKPYCILVGTKIVRRVNPGGVPVLVVEELNDMRPAAENLLNNYTHDNNLTATTALDGEEFIN